MSLRFTVGKYVVVGMLFVASHQTKAQKAVGAPPQSAERPLPVQNYAVIDLGLAGGHDYDNEGAIALDDSGNAAFGNLTRGFQDAFVRTFSNGVVSPAITYTHLPAAGGAVSFDHLLPTGKIVGTHYYSNDIGGTARIRGCFLAGGGGPSDLNFPPPYIDDDDPNGFIDFTTDGYDSLYIGAVSPGGGSIAYAVTYDGITRPDGSIYRPQDANGNDTLDGVNVITRSGINYFFASDTPSFLVSSDTAKYILADAAPIQITDTGWAVLDFGYLLGYGIWDGKQIVLNGLADAITVLCLNNEGWCLVDGYHYAGYILNGSIWHGGQKTPFAQLLAGTQWNGQLKQINPFLLSNQNTTDHSMYVVSDLLDNGNDEQVMWKATQNVATDPSATPSWSWQPYRMQYPANIKISWPNMKSVNSSGVIAAIGDAGTGNGHALLLVPNAIKLLNGAQSGSDGVDFNGKRPTKISDPDIQPDNPNYQNNISANDNLDLLGEDPIGRGRAGLTLYCTSLLVVAQAPLPNGMAQYKWDRKYRDRSVSIVKKNDSDGAYWYVDLAIDPAGNLIDNNNPNLVDDDTPPDYNQENITPSPKGFLYIYDNPGLDLNPATGGFHACNNGDYAYEKIDFVVSLLMQVGNSISPRVLHIGQIIKAKRNGNTGSWEGISNTTSTTAIPDCGGITEAEIRVIVGGSLRIVRSAAAKGNAP